MAYADIDFLLFVVKEKLSDNSIVYNVIFGEHKFAAVDQNAAEEFAEAIATAINSNWTTNSADVIYEY